MSIKRKLGKHNIHNTHDLIKAFAHDKGKAIMLNYTPASPHIGTDGTRVYSPFFKTDPDAHFVNHGCKKFFGNFEESMPKAEQWASREYGIDNWSPSPFSRFERVPTEIRERALASTKLLITPTKALKVFSWMGHRYDCPAAANGGRQTQEIVAASSMAAAARAAGVQRPRQLDNLTETSNDSDVAQAMSEPGTVFWRPYQRVSDKKWRRS
jgi:hypothetical protein